MLQYSLSTLYPWFRIQGSVIRVSLLSRLGLGLAPAPTPALAPALRLGVGASPPDRGVGGGGPGSPPAPGPAPACTPPPPLRPAPLPVSAPKIFLNPHVTRLPLKRRENFNPAYKVKEKVFGEKKNVFLGSR